MVVWPRCVQCGVYCARRPTPDRLWAQLSLNSTRSYINANSDYDAGDTTDFEYASSDIYINANYDNDSDDNADCHDASSDNYYI